jgi:YfiR/HmsC-like
MHNNTRSQSSRSPQSLIAVVALLAMAWLWCSVPSSVKAQEPDSADVPKEHMVKAVFLYSFGRYVEWPKTAFASPKSPFVIGILGEDWFGGALDEIAKKKTIQDRKIVIKRFAALEAFKEPCHILFVSQSLPADQQTALIAKMAGKPVFAVGETPGFAERGATANFSTDGNRVLVEINVEAVQRSHLRVDARLLSLAKRVGAPPLTADN